MIKSLLLKLGMLSMTIGVIFWVRWAPQPPIQGIPSAADKQVVASLATELEAREGRTEGPSSRNVQGPNIKAVAQKEPSKTAIHSRLDLNRASARELESLPGIGAVMAQRVVAFRTSVGGFRTVEDLREVKGIGAKTFDRLKSLVTVSTAKS
ncbi:MAG: helix-hairpin-helix domain-containing protein [Nitrospira sp.]|nr:helix-hairpin-helix domain-containing protein [Nitrospira sp.]